jgi:hypothetical protein
MTLRCPRSRALAGAHAPVTERSEGNPEGVDRGVRGGDFATERAAAPATSEVGFSSTRPGLNSETGVDTIRMLFATQTYGDVSFDLCGWRAGSVPALGLTWVEGHPAPERLATPHDVLAAGTEVRALVDDHFGVLADRGVSRLDLTTTRAFGAEREARAFLAGMATLDLPRCDTIRRGTPAHSIAWANSKGRRLLARCYDKGLERGGDPFRFVRLEDQRRFASGARPPVEVAADPAYQRDRFRSRFEPMRKAVDGVKAASFPVVAQALADEVKYGYRSPREAERLAGALVLLSGGAGEAYTRATYYRRRAELREAGYVVADDFLEPVEVELGGVLEASLAEWEREAPRRRD